MFKAQGGLITANKKIIIHHTISLPESIEVQIIEFKKFLIFLFKRGRTIDDSVISNVNIANQNSAWELMDRVKSGNIIVFR